MFSLLKLLFVSVDPERFKDYRHPDVDPDTFLKTVPFIVEHATKNAEVHGKTLTDADIGEELLVLQALGRGDIEHDEETEPRGDSADEDETPIMPSKQRGLALGTYSLVDTVRSIGQRGSFGPRGLGTLKNIMPPRRDRRNN